MCELHNYMANPVLHCMYRTLILALCIKDDKVISFSNTVGLIQMQEITDSEMQVHHKCYISYITFITDN